MASSRRRLSLALRQSQRASADEIRSRPCDLAADILGAVDAGHRFSLVLMHGSESGGQEASAMAGTRIDVEFDLVQEYVSGDSLSPGVLVISCM